MQPGAVLQAILLAVLLAKPRDSKGRLLSASDLDPRGGQLVCREGTRRPCYKVIYFHDAFQRLNFEEAEEACMEDGGQLVSIETEAEQRLIERLIENLLASDGDFWIGLKRLEEKQSNNTACQDLYAWTDGSTSQFRNWYVDEPSCGSEVCVVMYHQPSAPPGIGGSYLFQWNDDRCNMKNNFICKYADEPGVCCSLKCAQYEPLKYLGPLDNPSRELPWRSRDQCWSSHSSMLYKPSATPSIMPRGQATEPVTSILPEESLREDTKETFKERREDPLNRKREQPDPSTKEQHTIWPTPHQENSPNLDVYNVIRKQSEADLAEPRPDLKNISFRVCSGEAMPDDASGDYENMAVNPSESGFVTLASMESGFVTNDIYEFSPDRIGRSKESGWVENEIYY
ncbi:Layilin [Apodemus speciosus]|uniref:Layilin n=1 Tax=Apodemus speciosus TaxID=105296 RepID=A0ABQ0F4K3_APOSI